VNRIVVVMICVACGGAPAAKPKPAADPAGVAAAAPPGRPAPIDEVHPPPAGDAKPAALLDEMASELARSFDALTKHADPPYFASYEVTEGRHVSVSASFGALEQSSDTRHRNLDVDVRVGSYKLDNTHGVRGRMRFFAHDDTVSTLLPLDDDPYALRSAMWLATDQAYKHAAEELQKVQANAKVKAELEDKSDDFSRGPPAVYVEAPARFEVDRAAWEKRLRALSAQFKTAAGIETATVALQVSAETRYYASTDGTRYQIASTHGRVMISATTTADDGMALHRFEAIDVRSPDDLPTDAQIAAKIATVASDLIALRKAPVAEPYLGPAILDGKAASVFFHEVFGHRIEGHRQKNESEGQTFATKIGQSIMPEFITVYDDPTIAKLNGRDLNGFYRFDDEGIAAHRASLVEHGVLKTFLLSRAPARGFTASNGHGRRSEHFSVVARQANLVVAPSRTVDRATLKQMLLDQVRQQGKPYGLVFRELDGGFTMTQRFEPQSFKLLPIMVYRVYPDGREELVRGADLEGTPLRALADIVAASDDVDVFNGYCGAESGMVPVSSTSPSLLVAHVEVAKKPKAADKPPILPAPPWKDGAP